MHDCGAVKGKKHQVILKLYIVIWKKKKQIHQKQSIWKLLKVYQLILGSSDNFIHFDEKLRKSRKSYI